MDEVGTVLERGPLQHSLSLSLPRNDATEISEFLGHLTVKTQAQKDEFFGSLPPRLHSLPPHVVAEHLVPLLLTPLVMAEPEAHRWVGQRGVQSGS